MHSTFVPRDCNNLARL